MPPMGGWLNMGKLRSMTCYSFALTTDLAGLKKRETEGLITIARFTAKLVCYYARTEVIVD
ncbi:hypothetical protein ACFQ1T_09035 [Methylophilus glucosoxydans]|uniref:Uncharacterized protein n=1 Tax=Methylophilus glucosoxydans TaxID=752553 RepID=A0ABW3GMG4_9PROT